MVFQEELKCEDVSIHVLAWNAFVWTKRCVEAIIEFTPVFGELLLIDNCSTDETPAFFDQLAVQDPRIRVLHLSPNRGCPGGYNAGLRAMGGFPVIAEFNNDIVLTGPWLDKCLDYLVSAPNIGGVGHAGFNFNKDWIEHRIGDGELCDTIGGSHFIFRKELVDQVGYYDADYYGEWARDETDFQFRARLLGWRFKTCEVGLIDGAHQSIDLMHGPDWRREQLHQSNERFLVRWKERRDELKLEWDQ